MSQTGHYQPELITCFNSIFLMSFSPLLQQDLTEDLLPLLLDPIVTALKDDDDDVRAVAASALLPVAESLVTFAPNRVSTGCFRNFFISFSQSVVLTSVVSSYSMVVLLILN